MSTANSPAANDEISLRELLLKIKVWWNYLLSKWIIILLFGILGAAIGFAYAYYKKPIYTATTTFVLEDEKSAGGMGGLAGLASMAGVDLGSSGGGIFQGDNILELYKSRKMIEKTLFTSVNDGNKKQLLIERFISFNKLRDNWKDKGLQELNFSITADSLNSGPQRLRDSVIRNIVNDINKNYLIVSKKDKKLNIITAEVRATDEFFAKNFNEQIVKNVNDFYIQTKTKKSVENVAILQHKTDSVRAVMNGAIYNAAAVADATPNLNPTRQVQRVAPIQRSQFTAETNKAILGSLVQNLEMAKVTLLKEVPLIQVVDEPVYPLQKEKLGKLKALIFGGIIAGFFIVIVLLITNLFKTLTEDESNNNL